MPATPPPPPSSRFLSQRQRRLVGFAASFFALLSSIALLVVVVAVLSRLISYFSGVLWPLATAGILALILRPVVEALERYLRLRRLVAVVLLYVLALLALSGVLLLVLPPLIEQVFDFVAYLPTMWERALHYFQTHSPDWVSFIERQLANPSIKKVVDGLTEEAQGLLSRTLPSLKAAGVGVLNVFGFIAHVAIVPIYLFFFLLSSGDPTRRLPEHLPFLKANVRADVVFLVREFIAIVVSFFRGQLLIGLIMGALFALGFSLVGLRFGLFIGLTLGILNIVPYLGTIIGLGTAIPLAFFQQDGGWKLVLLVLGVNVVVQSIEGWFLTPKIMGDRTGLHPVVIIFAIFFWGTALNGILGMVLAIPLTAFFVTAWRLAKRKYFTA